MVIVLRGVKWWSRDVSLIGQCAIHSFYVEISDMTPSCSLPPMVAPRNGTVTTLTDGIAEWWRGCAQSE